MQEAEACSEISKFPSPESGGWGRGQKGAAWNSRAPPSGGRDASLRKGCGVALRRATELRAQLRVGTGDHAHRSRVAAAAVVASGLRLAVPNEAQIVAKAPGLDAHQVLGAGRGVESWGKPHPTNSKDQQALPHPRACAWPAELHFQSHGAPRGGSNPEAQ